MTTTAKHRTAAYARVSTQGQAENYSLPTQKAACHAYAEEQGWELPHDFVDEGHSGFSVERPALDELRDALKRGEYDVVIVFDVDRLSRRLVDLLCLDEECRRYGVEIHYVRYPVDASAEGYLFLQIRGGFAEYERQKIQERFRRGKVARAQAGIPGWGTLPYGYRYVSEGPRRARWEIEPSEAAVVVDIYRWLIDEGLAIRGIARRLNEREVKPRRGKGWGKTAVYRMLTYEGYTGRAHWNKTTKIEPAFRLVDRPHRKRDKAVKRDRAEWIPVAVPEIIPRDTFQQAQVQLDANSHATASRKSHEYLLTGHLYCPCGLRMSGNAVHGKRFYRCNGRDTTKVERCRSGLLHADHAEAIVWDRVTDVLERPEIVAGELAKEHERRQETAERQSFELDIKRAVQGEIQRKRRQWENAYENDVIDLDDFKGRMEALKAQERDIRTGIAELEMRMASVEMNAKALMSLKEAVGRVNKKLAHADFQRRRWVLDALSIRVVWASGVLEMSGVVPLGDRQSEVVPVASS